MNHRQYRSVLFYEDSGNGKEAVFHRWGEVANPEGSGSTTVAIIEDETGECKSVRPDQIVFSDPSKPIV